jgi:hypothetical protein
MRQASGRREMRTWFWWGSLLKKKTTGRHRCRWEDSNKMDVKEISWQGADWNHLAQDRRQVTGCCIHGNKCSDSVKYGQFLD